MRELDFSNAYFLVAFRNRCARARAMIWKNNFTARENYGKKKHTHTIYRYNLRNRRPHTVRDILRVIMIIADWKARVSRVSPSLSLSLTRGINGNDKRQEKNHPHLCVRIRNNCKLRGRHRARVCIRTHVSWETCAACTRAFMGALASM